MIFHYAGLNNSPLFSKKDNVSVVIDSFTKIPFADLQNIEIGWNCLLLWRNHDLYISGYTSSEESNDNNPQLLKIPNCSEKYENAQVGIDCISVLTATGDIWQYKIYEKTWKRVPNCISSHESNGKEHITKIVQTRCTVILTNLGRVFNIPTLLDMPKKMKFVDVVCGFDHTIMLSENGEIYSMGMGTRGQLGHGDLEDCDSPRCIEALAGFKVIQISACGWHSAVITSQGDLYTWGWNTSGQLGNEDGESKICAVPSVIDFKNESEEIIEVQVVKVQCGNNFTICMLEDGSIWGCGSNKYGQLGQPCKNFKSSKTFVKLNANVNSKCVKDFKCKEWGTCLVTD